MAFNLFTKQMGIHNSNKRSNIWKIKKGIKRSSVEPVEILVLLKSKSRMILVTLNIFLYISLALSDDLLATGINKFSLDLLNSLADSGSNENVLYSPISLHTALSQVLYGAEGNTQTELRTALGVRATEGLVRQYRDIRRRNQNLKTSNIIALHRGFSPKPTFINRLRAGFNSRVEEFDMVGDKTGTINEV